MQNVGNVQTLKFRLRHVAPFTFYISWGFVIVNILFGIALFSYHPKVGYAIVGGMFTFRFWACMFLVLGISGTVSLLLDHWRLTKLVLGLGLFIKALWFFALLFRTTDGGSLVTLVMWTFIAYMQLLAVIFFPDGSGNKKV